MPSRYGLLQTALEPQTICALDPSSDPSYRRYLDKVLRVHGKVCRQKDCLITVNDSYVNHSEYYFSDF